MKSIRMITFNIITLVGSCPHALHAELSGQDTVLLIAFKHFVSFSHFYFSIKNTFNYIYNQQQVIYR